MIPFFFLPGRIGIQQVKYRYEQGWWFSPVIAPNLDFSSSFYIFNICM